MLEKKLRVDPDKRELPIHIHTGFPIGIFNNQFSPTTYDYINWHWHDEIQYNVVLKGSFCFQASGKEYMANKGDGIFINTQQIHSAQAKEPDSSYLFVYFHPSLLSGEKDSYIYKTYITPMLSEGSVSSMFLDRKVESEKKILDWIYELKSIYDGRNKGYDLDILSSLMQLWKATLFCAEETFSISSQSDNLTNYRLKKIFSFLHENYQTQFTLQDIATLVALSRSECSRFFKQSVGQNLFEYIVKYRVNQSIDLLLHTDKSIAEIAYDVGFNSQSYYTKCFVSFKSTTPNGMRHEYSDKEREKKYLLEIGNDCKHSE